MIPNYEALDSSGNIILTFQSENARTALKIAESWARRRKKTGITVRRLTNKDFQLAKLKK